MSFVNDTNYFVSLLFQKAKGCGQHEQQTTYHVREQFSFEALEKIERKKNVIFYRHRLLPNFICLILPPCLTASTLHLSHHLDLFIHFISRFHPFFLKPPCSTASTLYLSHHLDLLISLQVPPIFLPPCSTASTLYLSHHLDLLTSSPGSTHLLCSTTSILYLSHHLKQKGVASILRFHPLYFYV